VYSYIRRCSPGTRQTGTHAIVAPAEVREASAARRCNTTEARLVLRQRHPTSSHPPAAFQPAATLGQELSNSDGHAFEPFSRGMLSYALEDFPIAASLIRHIGGSTDVVSLGVVTCLERIKLISQSRTVVALSAPA